MSWQHIVRSHSMSIDKARQQLGYIPKFTSLQAIADGLAWLAEHGEVDLGPDAVRILRRLCSTQGVERSPRGLVPCQGSSGSVSWRLVDPGHGGQVDSDALSAMVQVSGGSRYAR
jgi:hypothetical protein